MTYGRSNCSLELSQRWFHWEGALYSKDIPRLTAQGRETRDHESGVVMKIYVLKLIFM